MRRPQLHSTDPWRPLGALGVLGLAAMACMGAAPKAPRGSLAAVSAVVQDPQPVAMPERVSTGADARGEASRPRRLAAPAPWNGGPALPFGTARDREGSRKLSLEGRTQRRSFEGAPPVMPHSADFGEGSKECLDCHLEGMTLGSRVARPVSHSALPNCIQCHVESVHRDFTELGIPAIPMPGNAFRGRRPELDSKAEPANGMPPAIPHTLQLRTRCLSCHGQYGYEGLRTSHPERAVCVQCHLPVGAAR